MMYRALLKSVTLVALIVGARASHGQCRFFQPWDGHHAAHDSIVQSCDAPVPMDLAAMDDFICRDGGVTRGVRWWGTLENSQQIGRSYYIAIRRDNGNCQPAEVLYETCVEPQVVYVGLDCEDKRVFRFTTALPSFAINAGERYWLQISESDADSATPGASDFRWSGRQPVRLCPAAQIDAAGGVHQPLIDACDQRRDDLSFIIVLR